jgi:hypothetical protein
MRKRPWGLLIVAAAAPLVPLALLVACNDGPPPPSGPGNVLIDDTMEDAVAKTYLKADGSVYAPQGTPDAGDGGYEASLDAAYGSTGYQDVSSPMTACSSCKCDMRVGYCLENGSSTAFTSTVVAGYCSLADTTTPAVGCNPLPAACKANPTCACVLDAVQPPLPCYPECTSDNGYIDVFCHTP